MSQPHAHHEVRAAGRLFRLRIRLSSAMWVPVLAANLVAVGLGIGLPILDEQLGDQTTLPLAASAAQAIFGALAGGMITFTGIVFSAVFVAAQIQTSSYSPRLAARLRRDPVVIAGLALPTATAIWTSPMTTNVHTTQVGTPAANAAPRKMNGISLVTMAPDACIQARDEAGARR